MRNIQISLILNKKIYRTLETRNRDFLRALVIVVGLRVNSNSKGERRVLRVGSRVEEFGLSIPAINYAMRIGSFPAAG